MEPTDASKNLEGTVLKLYTAILKYLVSGVKNAQSEPVPNDSKYYTTNTSSESAVQGVFTIEELSKYLNDIDALEKTVGYNVQTAEAESNCLH